MILKPARLLVLSVLVSGSCSASSRPAPQPPAAARVLGRCLRSPPPSEAPAISLGGPAEGCPEAFETCLDRMATAELATYLDQLQSWARDAWTACGPEEGLERTGKP